MTQTYQIVEVVPTYHPFTDAANGARVASRSGYAYRSLALAHKIAGRMADRDYEDFGESSFFVIPTGGSPFSDALYPASSVDDDLPF